MCCEEKGHQDGEAGWSSERELTMDVERRIMWETGVLASPPRLVAITIRFVIVLVVVFHYTCSVGNATAMVVFSGYSITDSEGDTRRSSRLIFSWCHHL